MFDHDSIAGLERQRDVPDGFRGNSGFQQLSLVGGKTKIERRAAAYLGLAEFGKNRLRDAELCPMFQLEAS